MSVDRVGDDEAAHWPRVSPPAGPTSATRFAQGSAGHQLGVFLEEHLDAMLLADVALRSQSSIVQPTATVVRRIRNVLSVFDGFFDGPKAHTMAAELAWYADLLTPVERAEALAELMAAQLLRLPPELTFPSAGRHIQAVLGRERAAGLQQLRAAMQGERCRALLGDVDQWRSTIPFTTKADRPIRKVRRYLGRAYDELRDSLVSLGDATPERLSAASGAGERLDDAVSASNGAVTGKGLANLRSGAELLLLLQRLQHSVMVAEFLDRMGAEARPVGDRSGFTYGVLLERELKNVRDIRQFLGHHER